MNKGTIVIYTDGSCNPTHEIGGWAAILFVAAKKIVLSGIEVKTTHQRMELNAVIKAFDYLAHNNVQCQLVELYTDSQYVSALPGRRAKLNASRYTNAKNLPIRNADLVREVILYIDRLNVRFIKLKAHQKEIEVNINREVDKLARKRVREAITKEINK